MISRALGPNVETSDLYANGFDACEYPGHFQKRKNEHRFDVQAERRFGYENSGLAMEVNRELAAIHWADL